MSGFGVTSPKKRIQLHHMLPALGVSGLDCTTSATEGDAVVDDAGLYRFWRPSGSDAGRAGYSDNCGEPSSRDLGRRSPMIVMTAQSWFWSTCEWNTVGIVQKCNVNSVHMCRGISPEPASPRETKNIRGQLSHLHTIASPKKRYAGSSCLLMGSSHGTVSSIHYGCSHAPALALYARMA